MKFTSEHNNEIIELLEENKTNKEISILLGCSTTHVDRVRKKEGFPPSRGNYLKPEIRLRIIQLIKEEKYNISEISRLTDSNNATVKRIRNREIDKGNNLPEFKVNEVPFVPINQKYSDEELIVLVRLNPGYGFKRFCIFLSISEPFLIELLDDYKNYFDEDLYSQLQDESYITIVTEYEYKKITGKDYLPSGLGRRGNSAGTKASTNSPQSKVPLPPQVFNWGEYQSRTQFE